MSARLFIWQRLSALALVPLVLGHLALMIYAVRGGLSGREILTRLDGSWLAFLFFGAFVLTAAIHGAIGLRNIIGEWAQWSEGALGLLMAIYFIIVSIVGLTAVFAVTFSSALFGRLI